MSAAAQHLLSVRDKIFPAHPFSGLFAIGAERCWRLHEMFPEFAFDDRGQYCSQRRVNYLQAHESLLQALHCGGDELSILSGSRKSIPQLGAMGAGAMAQASYGDAITFALQYQLIAGSMLRLQLEVGHGLATLSAQPLFEDRELQNFLEIDHLATAMNVARAICPTSLPILRVELRSQQITARSAFEDFFQCPVVLGTDVSQLVISSQILDSPLQQNVQTALFSRQECEAELAAIGALGKQSLLQTLIQLPCESYSVQESANRLGLSVRSLHRMLAQEGSSYLELSESRLMLRAKTLLQAGLSVEDVAEQLNYADGRSFRRAFKRWTQRTPSAFRQDVKVN